MKIRQGFVTNSSSTSFIVSLREQWNKDAFLKSLGFNDPSSANKMFKQLFDAIEQNKRDINDVMGENDSVKAFLAKEGYEEETTDIVEKLLAEDRKVYYGELHSDGESAAEVYFCMESFLVCDDDIYFNGRIGGW